jgi:hypothetical protein
MKNSLIILLSLFVIPFPSCRNKREKELLQFGPFPLSVPGQNSLMAQWEKKPVLDNRSPDDIENGKDWQVAVDSLQWNP